MRGPLLLLTAGVGLAALSAGWVFGRELRDAGTGTGRPVLPLVRVAAPGRIEGRSETIELGASVDGVLAAVLVEEGEHVRAGQLLATVQCDDLQHESRSRRAAVDVLRQQKARLLRGGRLDERDEARAHLESASATARRAGADLARARALLFEQVISRAEFDRAQAAASEADATERSLRSHLAVVERAPLREDVAETDARLAEAQGAADAAAARLARCAIVAPADADVVRVHAHAGEAMSALAAAPVLSLADTSRLRVRAEVDELDLSRVANGERVIVTAPAFGDQHVTGHVVQISRLMGRKRVLSGDPAEKRDRDVLDVLVELDGRPAAAVLGLRVTVVFGAGAE